MSTQTEIEHKIAELEHANNIMSDELYSAQKRISDLERKVDLMLNVIKELKQAASDIDTPIDRPPHY